MDRQRSARKRRRVASLIIRGIVRRESAAEFAAVGVACPWRAQEFGWMMLNRELPTVIAATKRHRAPFQSEETRGREPS